MDSFKLKNKRVKYNFPVGYVHEYLTVTSEAYSVRKSSKSSFRCVDCLCACGNVAQVSLSRLGSGKDFILWLLQQGTNLKEETF